MTRESTPATLERMDTTEGIETRDEVLAIAEAACGFRPSEKQLKDWRRAGVLHRPLDQRGAGRKHGSTTYYPSGTGELLAAICLHSKPKKTLPQLAMLVWWDGHTLVDAELVRVALTRTLDDWERLTLPWVSLDDVKADDWIKLDRRLASRLPASLRSVRKLAGKGLFRRVTATLLNVAAGGFDGFHPYPPATGDEVRSDVEAALGVDRAAWITRGLADVLRELSTTLNPTALRGVLETSTPADLELARDEVRDLVSLIDTTRHLTQVFGGDVGRPFAHLDAAESLPSGNLAMLTLFWLSASRRPALRWASRELLPITRQLSALRQQLDTIRAIDTKKPPRRLAPSGSTAQGDQSPCTTSLSPAPPLNRPSRASWS